MNEEHPLTHGANLVARYPILVNGVKFFVYFCFYERTSMGITADIPAGHNDIFDVVYKANGNAMQVVNKHCPTSDIFVESWFDHFHQAGLLNEEYVSILFDLLQSHFNGCGTEFFCPACSKIAV